MSRTNKSKQDFRKVANLCINQQLAILAMRYCHCKSKDDLVNVIESQIGDYGGKRICEVCEYDRESKRFYKLARKSMKIPIHATRLHLIKTLIGGDFVKDPFDPLLVIGMWAKVRADIELWRYPDTDVLYQIKALPYEKWTDKAFVIRYDGFGVSPFWIEINCPSNIHSMRMSSGVTLLTRPEERELPWCGESPTTEREFEFCK